MKYFFKLVCVIWSSLSETSIVYLCVHFILLLNKHFVWLLNTIMTLSLVSIYSETRTRVERHTQVCSPLQWRCQDFYFFFQKNPPCLLWFSFFFHRNYRKLRIYFLHLLFKCTWFHGQVHNISYCCLFCSIAFHDFYSTKTHKSLKCIYCCYYEVLL